ncbi:cupin domain-containing protein [Streptomyces cynarae]|uniref:Cupin domain-containing protein n=1 Tax=Streptomyces cynarae TaxID=2981134 RepID=A0ABY6EEK5_9ACTN|nr:cupin domain-containing protein [Streptomyces cynarae]UXY24813.1 cupin domain-containing protein [Streptomyces cynarae]
MDREGFGVHWDDHDTIVVQLDGAKRGRTCRVAPADAGKVTRPDAGGITAGPPWSGRPRQLVHEADDTSGRTTRSSGQGWSGRRGLEIVMAVCRSFEAHREPWANGSRRPWCRRVIRAGMRLAAAEKQRGRPGQEPGCDRAAPAVAPGVA